jgi:response regulator RpfG family c-di-GMP phosphodiesterase
MNNGLPFSILVVDEDADDRFFMDEAFKEIGYEAEVKKFINGEALLHYLEQIDMSVYPSLIVLNDQMVGSDTKNVLSQLKENPAYHHIPVIVYSGVVSPTRKEQLQSIGAYSYIEKGMTLNDFVHIAQDLRHLVESRIEKS